MLLIIALTYVLRKYEVPRYWYGIAAGATALGGLVGALTRRATVEEAAEYADSFFGIRDTIVSNRRFEAEHKEGVRLIRELERALLFLEEGWPIGAREFEAAVEAYADFHWQHMRKEEHELLPLAERVLSAEDWRAIDRAFAANEDPVAAMRERDYEELFTRIANLAPEPVGLGERWERA